MYNNKIILGGGDQYYRKRKIATHICYPVWYHRRFMASFYPQDAHNQVEDIEHLLVVMLVNEDIYLSSNVLEFVGIGSLPIW